MARLGRNIYSFSSEALVAAMLQGHVAQEGMTDVRVPFQHPTGGERALELEAKSSGCKNPVLNKYQFPYSPLRLARDLDREAAFRAWEKSFREGTLAPFENPYYYAFITRDDGLGRGKARTPLDTIRFNWNQVVMLPAELANAIFLRRFVDTQRRKRGSFSSEEARDELVAYTRELYDGKPEPERSSSGGDWQYVSERDLRALVQGDEYATHKGRERIDELRELFPALDSLQGITYEGPSSVETMALYKPADAHLFTSVLPERVSATRETLEAIIRERQEKAHVVQVITSAVYHNTRIVEHLREQEQQAGPLFFPLELEMMLNHRVHRLLEARQEHRDASVTFSGLARFDVRKARAYALRDEASTYS